MEFSNQIFEEGSLPSSVQGANFQSCRFKGQLPSFLGCEFRGCDFSRCKVGELLECLFLSCNFDGADFSHADTRFSITNPVFPCSARGAEFQGGIFVMDCSFFGGLKALESDAQLFLIMATVPNTPLRKQLYRKFSDEFRSEVRRRTERNFRS